MLVSEFFLRSSIAIVVMRLVEDLVHGIWDLG